MMRMKFNRRRLMQVLAVIAIVVAFEPHQGSAGSLWRRRSPQHAFVFEDSRARRPGDLVTVIINESTSVNNSEDKALNKTSTASGVVDVSASGQGTLGGGGSGSLNVDGSSTTNRNFSGGATYRNSRAFIDRITVTVVGVTRNGNLAVRGTRQISIAGEHRMLTISGTIRPIDIGPDNTVSSQFVANMQTMYEDAGQERRFTRQGWFSRFLNKAWLF